MMKLTLMITTGFQDASDSVIVGTLWNPMLQIVTVKARLQSFQPILRLAFHQVSLVGSGLHFRCTRSTHLLPYQPTHYHKYQSITSVGVQYTLETVIIQQMRHHQNDIVLTQKTHDIHVNMLHI